MEISERLISFGRCEGMCAVQWMLIDTPNSNEERRKQTNKTTKLWLGLGRTDRLTILFHFI